MLSAAAIAAYSTKLLSASVRNETLLMKRRRKRKRLMGSCCVQMYYVDHLMMMNRSLGSERRAVMTVSTTSLYDS
jgi:hypothetical protein